MYWPPSSPTLKGRLNDHPPNKLIDVALLLARCVGRVLFREPEMPIASANLDLHELLAMSEEPK